MTHRLFVALWPPEPVVTSLDATLGPVRARYRQLRWQPPQRWHITLAFLGDRDEAKEIRRFGSIPPSAAEPIELLGSGKFGPVLWIGVGGGDWLGALAHDVQLVMDADRRFQPHVTVARARSAPARRELAPALADLAGFHSPGWTPPEMTLVRSTIGPEPEYRVVERRALAVNEP